MSFRTHLSVAGFGLAGIYAAVALVELVAVGDARSALVFGVSAAVTGLLIAILLPLIAPRRDDHGDDDGGGGPGGGGDGPPTPPWWPQFEREFWSYVNRPGDKRGRSRPRQRTPA